MKTEISNTFAQRSSRIVSCVPISLLASFIMAGLAFAQGRFFSGPGKPYDPKTALWALTFYDKSRIVICRDLF